ncbi:unnamed protein product [Calicophoron daubneyi]|uniref:Uncharacterized protein n=1 Tax=Calicophoron daubneyi TaxID=300641 RepID=A0AAV2T8H3_CALDB
MTQLLPIPPSYPKPPLNWSLQRRHSLIFPKSRPPLQSIRSNFQTERNTLCIKNSHSSDIPLRDLFQQNVISDCVSKENNGTENSLGKPLRLAGSYETVPSLGYTAPQLLVNPSLDECPHQEYPKLFLLPRDVLQNGIKSSASSTARSNISSTQNPPVLLRPHKYHQSEEPYFDDAKCRLIPFSAISALKYSRQSPASAFFPTVSNLQLNRIQLPSPNAFPKQPLKLLSISHHQPCHSNGVCSEETELFVHIPRLLAPAPEMLASCKRNDYIPTNVPLLHLTSNMGPQVKARSLPSSDTGSSDLSENSKIVAPAELDAQVTKPQEFPSSERQHNSKDKGVSFCAGKDVGVQFDFIEDEDGFIYKDYVINKDGMRYASEIDKQVLTDLLWKKDFLPPADEPPLPPILIKSLLETRGLDNSAQFLSMHSTELNEWDEIPALDVLNLPIQPSDSVRGNLISEPPKLEVMDKSTTPLPSPPRRDQPVSPITPTARADEDLARQSTVNPDVLFSDPVTMKVLESEIQTPSQKHTDVTDIWLDGGHSQVRLDLVKTLSELDSRLNAVGEVSEHLEAQRKKNEELLKQLIELDRLPNDISSSAGRGPNTIITEEVNDFKPRSGRLQHQGVNEDREEAPEMDTRNNVEDKLYPAIGKPSTGPSSSVTIPEQSKTKLQTESQRSRELSGSSGKRKLPTRSGSQVIARSRELARDERKRSLSAQRAEEAAKFANDILSGNMVMISSASGSDGAAKIPGDPKKDGHRPVANQFGSTLAVPPRALRARSRPLRSTRAIRAPRPQGYDPQGGGAGNERASISATLDDLPTTILSDWSVDSDVRRILYGTDEASTVKSSALPNGHVGTDAKVPPRPTLSISPTRRADDDQLTDGAPSSSYIDWGELDEILKKKQK